MLTRELEYDLPPDRIATQPAEPRDAAKLMVVRRTTETVGHHHVRDLPVIPGLLRRGDLLVFNQSKVLPAFFRGVRAATGGAVQGLYLPAAPAGTMEPSRWEVMLESRGTLRPDEIITLDAHAHLVLIQRVEGGRWLARLHSDLPTPQLLEHIGTTPLPPYIRKARKAHHQPEFDDADRGRYNTVYAADPGSVAAPTAGLHFTPALLAALEAMGVERAFLTLHVGLGTFAPIRTPHVENHPIHSEWFSVKAVTLQALVRARAEGRRIIPVGTTTVRALESLPAQFDPVRDLSMMTNLLIARPDYPFRFTDALLTNFHLPHSSLLALVASLPAVGIDRLKQWYQIAILENYRFYSYGDAMLVA